MGSGKQPYRQLSQRRKRGEVLQSLEQRFPCSPWKRPWRSTQNLQPMEDHVGTDTHTAAHGGPIGAGGEALKEATAHEDPMLEQASVRNCSLQRGAHAGAGFLAGAVGLWSGLFLKDCALWKRLVLEQFMKSCDGGKNTGAACEDLQPMGKTPSWNQGKKRRKWQRGTVMN